MARERVIVLLVVIMACGAKHHINAQSLSQSQKAMAAQSCLPILEAEAKARKVLAGRLFGENHPQEVVPVLAQPLESTENPTMLPKNNIKSAKRASQKPLTSIST